MLLSGTIVGRLQAYLGIPYTLERKKSGKEHKICSQCYNIFFGMYKNHPYLAGDNTSQNSIVIMSLPKGNEFNLPQCKCSFLSFLVEIHMRLKTSLRVEYIIEKWLVYPYPG